MNVNYFTPLTMMLAFAMLTGCSGSGSTNGQQAKDTKDTAMTADMPGGRPPQGMPPNGRPPQGPPPDGSRPPGGAPPDGHPGGPPPGGFGPGGEVSTGTGAYVLSDGETLKAGTYKSTKEDENAVRAEGKITATLDNAAVEKTGGAVSSNEASSFYGLNSAILALDGATLNINGGTVTATAEGANGVFAYGGATVNIKNTKIDVSGGNAGGIEVSGGGNMYASNLTVNAAIKAAIRSDRGGGKMVVDGGTYTTNGSMGAPAIYSTADITVSNATLVSNNSEAVVIEGFNSVTINNCRVSGKMNSGNGENSRNVMLYQSMSGDARIGCSTFTMKGGELISRSGDMFYVTNTSSVINLSGVKLTLADDTYLLLAAGNNNERGWGRKGENGGTCEFNLEKQTVGGNIMTDQISKLDMKISNSSAYTGAINTDGTTAASLSVTIDNSSTWTLTGDSYITELKGDKSRVKLNGHTLYINGKAMSL